MSLPTWRNWLNTRHNLADLVRLESGFFMEVSSFDLHSLAKVCRRQVDSILGWSRNSSLSLCFPPHCVFCNDRVPSDGFEPLICTACRSSLAPNLGPSCKRCATPVSSILAQAQDCPSCRNSKLYFANALSLGVYSGQMRETILRMKQSTHEALTTSVGWLLSDRIQESISEERPDVIVSVPMHWSRRLARGINQAELIAAAVSQKLKIPARHGVLRCCRNTKKQGTLSAVERRQNVRGAFEVSRGYDINGAKILIVDDVMTTGATSNEVARICKKAGANSVRVAVVARAGSAN